MLKWFTDNLLKVNPDKYQLVISTNEERHLNVGGVETSNSKCEKLLGIKIAYELRFDSHVKSLVKKFWPKEGLNPFLANVPILYPLKTPKNLWFCGVFRGYKMGTLARNGLMNTYLMLFQFTYASVVSMFHSCKLRVVNWGLSSKIINLFVW